MGRQSTRKAARRQGASAPPTLAYEKTYRTDDGHLFTFRERPSRRWVPMQRQGTVQMPAGQEQWAEGTLWENPWYDCLARYVPAGFPLGDSPYMILSISHLSETAVHDWRDFQRIKNDVCGAEWEGLELYPSESRLVDPSNRYYLWCVPPGIIPWGLPGGQRRVLDMAESLAPQRPFP